jgi:hypothetical protein
MQPNFRSQGKNQELLLPAASDCAWSGAIAKDRRQRLDEERLAGFNQSADLSTYPRKISVRTTRATALISHILISYSTFSQLTAIRRVTDTGEIT